MQDQIISLLAQGYKIPQVASMVGCSESYIRELFKESESFQERLKAAMVEHRAERVEGKYDALEEATLKSLEDSIGMAEIGDLTKVLESISRIKNAKRVPMLNNLTHPTLGVTLNMPVQMNVNVQVNDKNQIVAIGDKTLMPMPAKAVRDDFRKRMEAEKAVKLENKIKELSDDTIESLQATPARAAAAA